MRLVIAIVLFVMSITGIARATTTSSAKITDIRTDSSGFAIVGLSISASSARPACSAFAQAYAFDTSTAGGRNILSNLESAMLAGLTVTVVGKHACTVYTTVESIDYATV